jgi:hypothetical protein
LGVKDEVTGEWGKLYNETLSDLYSSPNIVWVVKLRRMKWTEYAAPKVERRGASSVLVGKLERKEPL